MKQKALLLAALVMCFSVGSFAGDRHSFVVPVNQSGITDSYALPCVPKYVAVVENSAVVPLLALDEGGIVYWAAITPATAGDYLVFRDSNTANSSSTAFLNVEAPTTTATSFIQFNPPIVVTNGLSVNVSSQTTQATVCVREADGNL
jgi:hypothetical protein